MDKTEMSYLHINNLYREQDILLFKECYAMEKVHGTSAHITWNNGAVQFSSGGAPHQGFKALFDENELIAKLQEHVGVEPAVIYGEAYGGKLMGMSGTYGTKLRFVVFDIKINDLWLAVPQAHALAENLGLEFVHYVKIPTELEAIDRERDADSEQAIRNGIGPGKIREGVVLRPLIELRKNNDTRIISKHKREEFRETKTERPVIDPGKLQVMQEAEQVADEWVTPRRLEHVLQRVQPPLTAQRVPEILPLMLEDVLREAAGEIVDSPAVRKAITQRTAKIYLQHLKNAG